MFSWIKYLLIIFIFVIGSIMVVNAGLTHEKNVYATQEISGALKSAFIGEMRENNITILDKKSLVSNLVIDIVKSENEKGQDIQIDYAFLDFTGQVTEDEQSIVGVQFLVRMLEDGEVKSSSTDRVMLSRRY